MLGKKGKMFQQQAFPNITLLEKNFPVVPASPDPAGNGQGLGTLFSLLVVLFLYHLLTHTV